MTRMDRIAGTVLALLFIGIPVAEVSEAFEWVGIDLPMTLRVTLVVVGVLLLVISARS